LICFQRQHLLESGGFPTINGVSGPLLFGAGARFFPASDLPMIGSLIDLESLEGTVLLGQIYGGIMATLPNGGPSTASSYVFDVVYTSVPEAGGLAGALAAMTCLAALTRRHRVRGGPA
jgi:hypothetical protein